MFLKFVFFCSIRKRIVHLPEDESWGNNIDQERPREARIREISPVQEAPRRVRDTDTRASDIRTLGRGVEAARKGTPHNVSFDTPFQTVKEDYGFKMSFFEQGDDAMNSDVSGDDAHYCSAENWEMAWMRETRITIFIQIELKAYWEELDGLTRCHKCAAYNCAEEKYPPRSLPIAPDYIDHLQSRLGKVKKGILPPTVKMIIKTYYHLPPHQAPVHPQQQEIPSCPQEEHLKTSLAVQPDDMTGRHRDGQHNPLE